MTTVAKKYGVSESFLASVCTCLNVRGRPWCEQLLLVSLCRQTHEEIQKRAVHAADLSFVVRNWLFGMYMVEYEQKGADRAVYGARFLETLADHLRPLDIKGTFATRLKRLRADPSYFSLT